MLLLPKGQEGEAVSEIGGHWVEVFHYKGQMGSSQYSVWQITAGKKF
jgi:hypothetical protein